MRTDSVSSLASSEFSMSSGGSSVTSVRDYSAKIRSIQQENFDLRLRIFLLEEKLTKQSQTSTLPMPMSAVENPWEFKARRSSSSQRAQRSFSSQRAQSYDGDTERQVSCSCPVYHLPFNCGKAAQEVKMSVCYHQHSILPFIRLSPACQKLYCAFNKTFQA